MECDFLLQMSELLDRLTKKQQKGEDSKKLVTEMERNMIEYKMNFEYVENKLLIASAENENLMKDIRNLEEHISSQRNNKVGLVLINGLVAVVTNYCHIIDKIILIFLKSFKFNFILCY